MKKVTENGTEERKEKFVRAWNFINNKEKDQIYLVNGWIEFVNNVPKHKILECQNYFSWFE